MKIDFDFKKMEKDILSLAKMSKLEFECPKCGLYVWEYSLKDLEQHPEVYCNNCDSLITYEINL